MGVELRTAALDAVAVGAGRPTAAELAELTTTGWVVVPDVLAEPELEGLRAAFELRMAADPAARTNEVGNRRTNVGNDDEAFAICWRHRLVLDAASHLLGPVFQAGGVDLREPELGGGIQGHHPDHGPTQVLGLTATWFLDAFTPDNGAIRVIPGTHRSTSPPAGARSPAPAPGEAVATGPAGSVLLRDARLWHAAGRNRSGERRRAALVFYQHHIP